MDPKSNPSQYSINGRTHSEIPATRAFRVLALLLDLGVLCCLYFAYFLMTRGIPSLSWSSMLITFVLGLLTWSAQKFLFGVTLAERLWGLSSPTRFGFKPEVFQESSSRPWRQTLGIFLTVFSFLFSFLIALCCVAWNPIGMNARPYTWEAYFPEDSNKWTVMPFFYSLGAWPRLFPAESGEKEVLYTLPYEKGPPDRFAGHVTARWDFPHIRVLMEGPKSPLTPQKTLYERTEIQNCLTQLWSGGSISLLQIPHCIGLRQAVLERHVEALRALRPTQWELHWVQVPNRALDLDQQLQGIYISASNEKRGQDRFILITARGTHQTFILDYPKGPSGEAARELFQKALRSLRVSDDLNPGRAWVDQALEKVNLQNLTQMGPSEIAIHGLSQIQALLIAKISVDPKTYDAFFHLAGTSIMLARAAVKLRQLPAPDGNPALASDILLVVKPIIENAYKYALDVSPSEPRNSILAAFHNEALKL